MFCSLCGKKDVPLLDNLCADCYASHRKILESPTKITIIYCNSCGKYKVGGKWTDDLTDFLRRKMKFKGEITDFNYSLMDSRIHITLKGIMEDTLEIELERDINLSYEKRYCQTCFSKLMGSYTAKVQLRGEDLERALKFLNFKRISKSERVKGGIDIFFINKDDALSFANRIAKKYGSKVVRSRTLVGVRDGQRDYKETLSVRI